MVLGLGHGYGKMSVVKKERIVIVLKEEAIVTLGMYVEPGAQMYKRGNVTIFFLSHVFFLIFVVCHPYFHFAPLYKEVNHYLLAFTPSSSPLFLPL